MSSEKEQLLATKLAQTATTLAEQLLASPLVRLVCAESCTAGMVSATLAHTPGISGSLCGSAVTYRAETKTAWLGVSAALIQEHTAVSAPVTAAMAISVMKITPEANFSVAITGHLGPGAPPSLDGTVFIALAIRDSDAIRLVWEREFRLETTRRDQRQSEATLLTLQSIITAMREHQQRLSFNPNAR